MANLGLGYALMFNDMIDESLNHFTKLKEKNETRRVLLGYYLCQAIKEPSEESLTQIASLSLVEPRFFFVVFRAAEILEKAGKLDESRKAYKRAYEVLLRMFRRKS